MLDHLSHGRLEFGAGLGTLEHEFTRWSIPYDERRELSIESLEIILKAWTEESVTYQGKYWQFDEALPMPKPISSPIRPSGLPRTARHRWNTLPGITSMCPRTWMWTR
jgi:alkanesulfonate monooxygenase SsuD/methylene tetrahydromethanopterin reductase-like flavin-dependent oxidoreductase (luciferase family)